LSASAGSDAHDAASGLLRLHLFNRKLRDINEALEVSRDESAKVVCRVLRKRFHKEDAGVRDDRIDRAELFDREFLQLSAPSQIDLCRIDQGEVLGSWKLFRFRRAPRGSDNIVAARCIQVACANLMASNRENSDRYGGRKLLAPASPSVSRAGYDVVGTARSATKSKELPASEHLALIDGDIGRFETAQKVAELAIKKFGSIDAVVANAGIFFVKPFTEYTADDFRALVSTNLQGFIYIAQLAVKQMQAQKDRRQHREHHCSAGRQSNCRRTRFPFYDH